MISKDKITHVSPCIFMKHPVHDQWYPSLAEYKRHKYRYQYNDAGDEISQVIYTESNGMNLVLDGWIYLLKSIDRGCTTVAAQKIDTYCKDEEEYLLFEFIALTQSQLIEKYRFYNDYLIRFYGKTIVK